jgi:hypothetical protein
MGSKILLNGHTGYRGDFDISPKAMNGTHALYTKDEASTREIMFHCAPWIKSQVDEEGQQIVRKRFVGNDISCIVFQEGGSYPNPIRSQFLHCYIIVSPVEIGGKLHYRISVATKEGVEEFGPTLCSPTVIEHGPFARQFILAKVINAHLAALRSPKLSKLLVQGVKDTSYKNVLARFTPTKSELHKLLSLPSGLSVSSQSIPHL